MNQTGMDLWKPGRTNRRAAGWLTARELGLLLCVACAALAAQHATAAPVISSLVASPSTNVFAHTPVTLAVEATGSGSLRYQWRIGVPTGSGSSGFTISQGATDNFVALEAESYQTLVQNPGNPYHMTYGAVSNWIYSGGQGLEHNGDYVPGTKYAYCFVVYWLQFSQPGTYRLYERWRADAAYINDNNDGATANSCWIPRNWGDLSTNSYGDSGTSFATSASNGTSAPGSTNVPPNWAEEPAAFTVSPAQVGTPLSFTLSGREPGMILDRLVFSQTAGLSSGQLDALANSVRVGPADTYTWSDVAGATNSTLVLPDATIRNSGFYDVVVWDESGTNTSSVLALSASEPELKWAHGAHSATITGIGASTNGQRVVTASEDGTVKLWSWPSGELVRTWTLRPSVASAVALSPDGSLVAAGNYRGLVRVWEAAEGAVVRSFSDHLGKVTALAFSADGALLASGGAEGTNTVRRMSDGGLARQFIGYSGSSPRAIHSLACSAEGLLASGCEDRTVKVWNLSSGAQVWSSQAAHSSNVTAVAFSPAGGLLGTASRDGTARTWSTGTWTAMRSFVGHTGAVTCIAFSPDGTRLSSGGEDQTVRLWTVSDGSAVASGAGHRGPVTAIAFSPDGGSLISGGTDSRLRLWQAADGAAIGDWSGQSAALDCVAVAPDGSLVAMVGTDLRIRLIRLSDGAAVWTLAGHSDWIQALAFSPDSRFLASGGGPLDAGVKLWNLDDGSLAGSLAAGSNGVTALAFSPDGRLLAGGGDHTDRAIFVWETLTGAPVSLLPGHTNGVTALAFSPDGSKLASAGRKHDAQVRLWDFARTNLLQSLAGTSADTVNAISFSPDGGLLAAGGGNVTLWNLTNASSQRLATEANPVLFVAFSPDGTSMASGTAGSIKLWDVAAGTLTQTLTNEASAVRCLAYSPNGNLFAFGRADATLVLAANPLPATGQPPLAFSGVSTAPEGTLLATAPAANAHYLIQYSEDLRNWVWLTNAFSTTTSMTILDPASGAPVRFYRALTPP